MLSNWFLMLTEEWPYTDDSNTPGPTGPTPSAPTSKDVSVAATDTHNVEPAPAQGGSFKGGGKQRQVAVPKNKTVDHTGPNKQPGRVDQRANMTIEPGTISSAGGQFSAKMTQNVPSLVNNKMTDSGFTAAQLATGSAAAKKAGREAGIYVDGVKQDAQDTSAVNGEGPKDQGDGATTNLAPGRKPKGIYVPTAMDQSPDNWEMVPGTGNPNQPVNPRQGSQMAAKQVPADVDKIDKGLDNVVDKALSNGDAKKVAKTDDIPDEVNPKGGPQSAESIDTALSSIVESWK